MMGNQLCSLLSRDIYIQPVSSDILMSSRDPAAAYSHDLRETNQERGRTLRALHKLLYLYICTMNLLFAVEQGKVVLYFYVIVATAYVNQKFLGLKLI